MDRESLYGYQDVNVAGISPFHAHAVIALPIGQFKRNNPIPPDIARSNRQDLHLTSPAHLSQADAAHLTMASASSTKHSLAGMQTTSRLPVFFCPSEGRYVRHMTDSGISIQKKFIPLSSGLDLPTSHTIVGPETSHAIVSTPEHDHVPPNRHIGPELGTRTVEAVMPDFCSWSSQYSAEDRKHSPIQSSKVNNRLPSPQGEFHGRSARLSTEESRPIAKPDLEVQSISNSLRHTCTSSSQSARDTQDSEPSIGPDDSQPAPPASAFHRQHIHASTGPCSPLPSLMLILPHPCPPYLSTAPGVWYPTLKPSSTRDRNPNQAHHPHVSARTMFWLGFVPGLWFCFFLGGWELGRESHAGVLGRVGVVPIHRCLNCNLAPVLNSKNGESRCRGECRWQHRCRAAAAVTSVLIVGFVVWALVLAVHRI